MILTPSGNLSTSLSTMQTLIATGTNFKTWTKKPTLVDAKTQVYPLGCMVRTRPCVMIAWKSGSYRQPEGWSGFIQAIFEANTGSDYLPGGRDEGSFDRAGYEFTNYIGPIIEEMMDNQESASGGYPLIDRNRGIQFAAGLARGDITAPTDFHQWTFMIPWGLS